MTETYIIGEPCEGGRPANLLPFALPLRNVLACGVVNGPQWCFKFDPIGGRRTNDPFSLGAIIGTQVVTGQVRTCCDCLADLNICNATTLASRPEWRNAVWVLDSSGAPIGYRFSPAAVSGRCCCKPGDLLSLIPGNAYQRYEEIDPDTGQVFFEAFQEFVVPRFPLAAPDVIGGFRRDANLVQYGLRDVQRVNGTVISDDDFFRETIGGPVGCEWIGFANNWSLDNPHFYNGSLAGGLLGGVIPVPNAAPFPPPVNGWYIKSYYISANCGVYQADAVWERLVAGTTLVDRRLTARQWWRVLSDTAGQCSGGCGQSEPIPPILPIGPGGITPIGPGPFANGCAGCGGGGGL